jgi:hypothetical protein
LHINREGSTKFNMDEGLERLKMERLKTGDNDLENFSI